jgi:hypothetical protein
MAWAVGSVVSINLRPEMYYQPMAGTNQTEPALDSDFYCDIKIICPFFREGFSIIWIIALKQNLFISTFCKA